MSLPWPALTTAEWETLLREQAAKAKSTKPAKIDLGGAGSGNFGHAGRPGAVGGSGPGVPAEPGTTPIPPGMIRAYHYTKGQDALTSILEHGLSAEHAKGSSYGEPNVLWFSTAKPNDDKHYVEVFLTPEDVKGGVGGPSMTVQRSEGWKAAATTEERQEALDRFNAAGGNFAAGVAKIPASRIVTHSEPWMATYHALVNPDPASKAYYDKKIEKILAGGMDQLAARDPDKYGKIIPAIKAKFGKKDLRHDLGGTGSGNFGHAGRPGEVGGSEGRMVETAGGQVHMVPATADDADRLKALRVPPKWTDVHLSADPTADLQAVGTDVKGRTQYLYSAAHSEKAAAEKFERLHAFHKVLPALREQIHVDLQATSLAPATREAAVVLHLIDKTGFRIGSDAERGGDKKAFGASTLEARHVQVDGDKVRFRFVGKKGVPITKTIEDPILAKELGARKAAGGPRDPLFPNVSDADVRDYLHARDGDFKVKDFRTWHGTFEALKRIEKIPTPLTEKDLKKAQREVCKAVAAHLGNTPAVAKASYIDPAVWSKWKARKQ